MTEFVSPHSLTRQLVKLCLTVVCGLQQRLGVELNINKSNYPYRCHDQNKFRDLTHCGTPLVGENVECWCNGLLEGTTKTEQGTTGYCKMSLSHHKIIWIWQDTSTYHQGTA
ncbi:hypothetical protein Pmani_013123 [Petrolisthes manimaculis]|uniref:Uncharacterized protein n=1 Tax=Petrolisthes manimaculis TaxID=1843537 RepID=A0AAE1PVN0_9EUCA|nr:hypothetical protein Pmani_013123 [Petrolisthes manimaculis]